MWNCKKIVFYLLFLLFIVIKAASSNTQTTMNTSISLAPNLFLSVSTDKNSYCPPENVSIISSIENRGNLVGTSNLFLFVTDPYGTGFKNSSWNYINVNAGQTQQIFYNYTVSDNDIAGIYTAEGNITWNGKTRYNETTYRVKKGFGSLVSSPSQIERTVFPGDVIAENVYFWLLYPCYATSVYLNTSEGPPGNWVYFSDNPIYLSPEIWNVTIVIIFIDLPWNTIPGDYIGNIIASIEGQIQLYIPVIIHVQTTGIFDVTTEVLSQYKEVCRGNQVTTKTTVIKIFPSGTFDIDLTYNIQNNNTIYDQRNEDVAITDQIERYTTLQVPSNAPLGVYTFYSILNASGNNWTANVVSYDIFQVNECIQAPSAAPSVSRVREVEGYKYEEGKLILNVSRYKILTTLGNSTSFLASIKNTGNSTVQNIKLYVDGIPNEWITIFPYKYNLNPGEQQDFLVVIKPTETAKEGIYSMRLIANNTIKSNEVDMVFILGMDEESLTLTLYKEVERVRNIANKTIVMSCLEISEINSMLKEGDELRKYGLEEMKNLNYKKAQVFFVQSLTTYENIIIKADVLMYERFSNMKPLSIFPFSQKIKSSMERLAKNVEERDYEEFCNNIEEITKNSIYSIILLIIFFMIIIGNIAILVSIYRRRKERELEERIKKIKERLK